MISIENIPTNVKSNDFDFTVHNYTKLLGLALASYKVASFDAIPWGDRFVLWRHDCDFSLNRSYALAKIEASLGMKSTYFVNPHSEFYNLLERDQCSLVQEILKLGHNVGLHFDAEFYDSDSEEALDIQVDFEADLIKSFIGIRPTVFSFHNPTSFHLTCEADTYGNLVNCYSKKIKEGIPYCSDSNGYWRFRRLHDVLAASSDPCLHVLTHPGWWQDVAMNPRSRIFHSAFGRAQNVMRKYDRTLKANGRSNLRGKIEELEFLKDLLPDEYETFMYLWSYGAFEALFVVLWCIHKSDLYANNLRKMASTIEPFGAPSQNTESYFGTKNYNTILNSTEYIHWKHVFNRIVNGGGGGSYRLEDGCVYICKLLKYMKERIDCLNN